MGETVSGEVLGNLLDAIDLYWDEVLPLLENTFEMVNEEQIGDNLTLNTARITRKFDPDYKISYLESDVIIAGDPPLNYPKLLTEFEISPESLEKRRIRVRHVDPLSDSIIDEKDIHFADLPTKDNPSYQIIQKLQLGVLYLLVEEGMQRGEDDPIIDKIKKIAYKAFGDDAEELWQ